MLKTLFGGGKRLQVTASLALKAPIMTAASFKNVEAPF